MDINILLQQGVEKNDDANAKTYAKGENAKEENNRFNVTEQLCLLKPTVKQENKFQIADEMQKNFLRIL